MLFRSFTRRRASLSDHHKPCIPERVQGFLYVRANGAKRWPVLIRGGSKPRPRMFLICSCGHGAGALPEGTCPQKHMQARASVISSPPQYSSYPRPPLLLMIEAIFTFPYGFAPLFTKRYCGMGSKVWRRAFPRRCIAVFRHPMVFHSQFFQMYFLIV